MLEISEMPVDDLSMVLSWAAGEGWNPGLDDAAAFHAADPAGFLLGRLDGQPVAAISVVAHSDSFAFLGLYLCRPEFRGQGHGWALWQEGMRRLGRRCIGLDGVADQQANYEKSGFTSSHRTIRHTGTITGVAHRDITPLDPDLMPKVLAWDARIVGYQRPKYLQAWLTDTANRKTLICQDNDTIHALGTIRKCINGFKIGPLFAENTRLAEDMMKALAHVAGADQVILDVPDHNHAALTMARDLSMTPDFETARMYSSAAPKQLKAYIFGETTLELG